MEICAWSWSNSSNCLLRYSTLFTVTRSSNVSGPPPGLVVVMAELSAERAATGQEVAEVAHAAPLAASCGLPQTERLPHTTAQSLGSA